MRRRAGYIALQLCLALYAASLPSRAQSCCGRLDLPLAGAQRGANKSGEFLGSFFYEYGYLNGGLVEEGFGIERMHSHRGVLDLSYGVTAWLTPNLTLPVGVKLLDSRIAGDSHLRHTQGLADSFLLLKFSAAGASSLAPGSLRLWLAPGVKFPTGSYRATDQYGPLPPETQMGSGTFDPIAAAFASVGLSGEGSKTLLLSSVVGRLTTENSRGFRFGRTVELASLLQFSQVPQFGFRLGPQFRLSGADRQAAQALPNSGAWLLFARGGVVWNVAEDIALNFDAQTPVVRCASGTQLDPVFTASVGVLISRR